jgi:hypothetical protein
MEGGPQSLITAISANAKDGEDIRNTYSDSKAFQVLGVDNIQTIYFDENWDVGIGGGLWSTGVAMAYFFRKKSSLIRESLSSVKAKKALELGSGNGFVSVSLLASLPCSCELLNELVITDLEEHLPLIQRTLNANQHIIERFHVDINLLHKRNSGSDSSSSNEAEIKNSSMETMKVIVAKHAWGEFASSSDHLGESNRSCTKFDFIFGSDIAYRDSLHRPLIQSLVFFSHYLTIILLGVTMYDTKPTFFDALWTAGFTYIRIADDDMMPKYRGKGFGLFLVRKRHIHVEETAPL